VVASSSDMVRRVDGPFVDSDDTQRMHAEASVSAASNRADPRLEDKHPVEEDQACTVVQEAFQAFAEHT